jgi:adenylate cyclase
VSWPEHVDDRPEAAPASDLPTTASLIESLTRSPNRWSLLDIAAWLLAEGRFITDPTALLDALADRLLRAGAPLWRIRFGMRTLHPEVAAWAYIWIRGQGTTEERIEHGVEDTDAFLGSPIETVFRSRQTVRRSLIGLDDDDHPILHQLALDGGTDYFAIPLIFNSGAVNILVLVTDRASGFCDDDVPSFQALSHVLAPIVETAATRRLAETLLNTYVGPRTGKRILHGHIRRGDAETIKAVVWFSDLRDFTAITEHLPVAEMLDLLNAYFEFVSVAVTARGGEILRFIGDAMLVVFPITETVDARTAARAAVDAALDTLDGLGPVNHRRRRAGKAEIRFGIGLNVGTCVYGNVGARDRLDYTVMGAVVNRAARIEDLTKKVNKLLLFSADVANLLSRPVESVGSHWLKGVDQPMPLFALANHQ